MAIALSCPQREAEDIDIDFSEAAVKSDNLKAVALSVKDRDSTEPAEGQHASAPLKSVSAAGLFSRPSNYYSRRVYTENTGSGGSSRCDVINHVFPGPL